MTLWQSSSPDDDNWWLRMPESVRQEERLSRFALPDSPVFVLPELYGQKLGMADDLGQPFMMIEYECSRLDDEGQMVHCGKLIGQGHGMALRLPQDFAWWAKDWQTLG